MKKNLFLVIMLFPVAVFSQLTNLVFFTEQGEKFSLIMNGIRQNDSPETNIMITGLPAPSYKVKIIFEDPKLPPIDKTLYFQQGTETTYNIKKNNKGEYVIRFLNQIPLAEVLPPPSNRHVIVFSTEPPLPVGNQQTQVTSTTITMPGFSTTSTTSVQTTTVTSQGNVYVEDHGTHENPVYIMPGYHGPVGCPHPITELDFRKVKETISARNLEDSKLTIAKQVTASNCLFAAEVKEIMMLFTFETTRLEFAKYAYRYTYDIGNYYVLNDAFKFESSIEDLNEFIQGRSN